MGTFAVDDKNIVALSNSLLKWYGVVPHHNTLSELDEILRRSGKKNIVFMILDCLGTNILQTHLAENSFLRRNWIRNISSVFPPTTTAATASLHSGLYPLEHGWLGWMPYFKEYDEIIEVFLNRAFYTRKMLKTPPAADLLRYESIYRQIVRHNPDVEYHKIFPAFMPGGAETFVEICRRINAAATGSCHRKIISAYWHYPDAELHKSGVNSPKVTEILTEMDALLSKMAEELRDTLLIITADHGIVNVEDICLNDYPELVACFALPPSLEARFASFFVHPDKKDFFAYTFKELFSEDFLLFSKQEFLAGGFLGKGRPHPLTEGFIGSFVAVGTGNKSLRFKTENGVEIEHLAADHAGLTPEEMNVPLIVWRSD